MDLLQLAGALYTAYCEQTNFKSAVTGAPLPTWGEMTADESKSAVVAAWVASANAAVAQIANPVGEKLVAKMVCQQNKADELNRGSVLVELTAVTTGSEENKSFAEATPSARFNLTISNPAAHDFFQPLSEYLVEFKPATKG